MEQSAWITRKCPPNPEATLVRRRDSRRSTLIRTPYTGGSERLENNLPADDVDLARKLVKASSWEARFTICLKDDSCAQNIFTTLVNKGVRRRRLTLLLPAVSDPDIGVRLQRFIGEGVTYGNERVPLIPSKDNAVKLARRLRCAAAEIRCFWGRSLAFALLPYSKRALDTADSLDEQADALKQIRWAVITKKVGFKALWRQFPIIMLCRELHMPKQISYIELAQLLRAAVRAHLRHGKLKFTSGSVRRQYDRFRKRSATSVLLIDAFLKFGLPPN